MSERMWCQACGTVTADMICDCNHWGRANETYREPQFLNYADTIQKDMQEVMGINNMLRDVLLEVRQFINDATLGDEAHAILAKIDKTVS